jgi:succinate dehydrogenase/fumarate reductase flavoprotein subunit
MHQEIMAGRAAEHGGILLDFTQTEFEAQLEDYLSENAPFLLDYVRRIGLPPDVIFKKPIEVGPAAHYSCGGIAIDTNCETSIPGLLAAGEATGGVHGANRLGNNAMTDIFVFGRIAGEQAAAIGRNAPRKATSAGLLEQVAELEKSVEEAFERQPSEAVRTSTLRAEIESIMFRFVGFGREKSGLEEAIGKLDELQHSDLPRTAPLSRSRFFNYDLVEIFELRNLIDIGRVIARAALERTETRGCHNRSDYPDQDDSNWLTHILVSVDEDKLRVEKSPVITD